MYATIYNWGQTTPQKIKSQFYLFSRETFYVLQHFETVPTSTISRLVNQKMTEVALEGYEQVFG